MAELEALVLPIADGSPAGSNLRLDASDLTFQRIQQSRSEVLPEVDPTGAGKPADWAAVARDCEAALKQKSKDLELAAWLAEAWSRTRGFGGLRDGLRLTLNLCDAFWDSLHPGLEDGALDLALRARPLTWLGSSRNLLRSVSLSPLVAVEGRGPLSFEDHKLALLVDEKAVLPDKRQHQEMVARGLYGAEEWRARLTSAGSESLAALHAEVTECQKAVAALRELVAKRFPDGDAPNLIPLTDLLGEIRAQLDPHVAPPPAPAAETPAAAPAASQSQPAAAPAARGPIASRADALRALAEAGEYFRKHEPHSPISPLISRAVRWGSMPFEAVLREVVQDDAALAKVWNTLGITTEGGADAAKKK